MSYLTYNKTGLVLALSSTLLLGISTASAAEHKCYKPGSEAMWQKIRIPQGNWSPIHDTKKWSYDAIPGGDIFRHRNGNRTVGTRCQGTGYDYGTLKIDFEGNQDWCAKYVPASVGSIQIPTCSSGYTLSADNSLCTKPATSAYWQKNRQPKGNWSPIHDTRKWSYDAVPGGDIFRHRNGNRTVGTRCQGTGYDYGTLKIDFEGNQDWCAKYVNGTSASSVTASCPSGHQLQTKPAVNEAIASKGSIKQGSKEAISRPATLQQFEMKELRR